MLDLESPLIFTIFTVAVWILIAILIEAAFTDGSLESGFIKGLAGGIAYSITYNFIQKIL